MNRLLLFLAACLFLLDGVVRAEVLTAMVTVEVRDYTVVRTDGVDAVAIPDGVMLDAPEGRPEVPCCVKMLAYPVQYRIQDVVLKAMSDAKADSGLRLPIAQPDEGPAVPAVPGIFPTADFAWSARYDDSVRVALSVYPFRYDPKTRKATFHRHFEFEIRYVKTTVAVTSAEADTPVYDPGRTVRLRVRLENSGEPQEVKVRASVRRGFSDRSLAEVPARTIARLGRTDSVALEWPTANQPSGDYTAAVVVSDAAGSELDRKRVSFRLGDPNGEVVDFRAEPRPFKLGGDVRFLLEFRNTGTCDLAGECVIRITKAGEVVDELRRKMTALKPGGTATFRDSWDTGRAEKSVAYAATGFVEYEGTASNARSVMLSTNAMPTATFTLAPDSVRVGQEVGFDASASTDTDGSVVLHRWEFGDGGKAEGNNAAHKYYEPGDYSVRLTVTDNENGSAEVSRTVTVTD